MDFTKMHGIGNDYVFIDVFEQKIPNPAELARQVSPRNFSIGSDGLILIAPSETADVKMRIFNADGSEAEMCGNGIRCVAKYAWDHQLCRKNPLTVETLAGLKQVELFLDDKELVSSVRVDMGVPRLQRSEIPMRGANSEHVIDEKIEAGGQQLSVTCVSMGNPHCIVPVKSLENIDWRRLGEDVESHELFPERTNVHFVKVISPDAVKVKTWERGSGATLACGTGASAVGVAMHMLGYTDREITVSLPGGDLEIQWCQSSGNVYMTGPAEEVFRGQWKS